MNVTLTLSPAVARWAAEQPTGIDALHAVLEEHVKAVESPYNQAWRALEARIPALPWKLPDRSEPSHPCRGIASGPHRPSAGRRTTCRKAVPGCAPPVPAMPGCTGFRRL